MNGANSQGKTTLDLAVNLGSIEHIRRLLEGGASPKILYQAKLYRKLSPYHFLFLENRAAILSLLIDYGFDINVSDVTGSTPLMTAISHKDKELVELVIHLGARTDAWDRQGEIPIVMAAGEDSLEILKLLVETYHVDVNSISKDGYRPLLKAAQNGLHANFNYLLGMGADPKFNSKTKLTPLMAAIKRLPFEDVKTLLDLGVDPTFADKNGNRALHFAAGYGSVDSLQLLIAAGVNLEVKNKNGETALFFAVVEGNIENVKALINAGANKNVKNNFSETLLDVTTSNEIAEIFQ